MPQTIPDGLEFETPDDEPARTLHGGRAGDSAILAEQVQALITELRTSIAQARTRELYTTLDMDEGFPVVTGSTTAQVVFARLTVPAVPYERLLDIHATVMLQCSTLQPYDAYLYVGTDRIDINRADPPTTGEFRSAPLNGHYWLDANVEGVVEVRHARVGSTGTCTPSVGSGSYELSVATWRAS